ncbi:MAG: hypothetical protein AAF351_02155 [Pseudomonadota bacterium]
MISALFFALAGDLSVDTPQQLSADIAWIAENEFCEPETVLPLPDDTLLVSNVCDFRTEGDGYLTLLAANGDVIEARRVDGLDSPLGMTLVDDKLYVVDNNTVKIFHWPSYQQQSTVALQTAVANDIAVADDGTMYITDTSRGEVARVSPSQEHTLLENTGGFAGANGIHIYGDELYVGGETLWRVDLADDSVGVIGPEWLTDIDGIEMERDGTLQVTPVGGPLIRLAEDVEMYSGEGVSSANHGYAESLGLVLIPTGFDNAVIAIRVHE